MTLCFCFLWFQETKWYDETTVELMAPTMLPELHLLKRVKPENVTSPPLDFVVQRKVESIDSSKFSLTAFVF